MYVIQVNYLAIVITALISFVLGITWYSDFLFGTWIKNNLNKHENETGKNDKPGIFVLAFICLLNVEYILAVFIHYSGAPNFGYGMLAGFLSWFGFVVCMSLSQVFFAGRSVTFWLINSGYSFLALIFSAGILASWS